jgi:hypothetical protein
LTALHRGGAYPPNRDRAAGGVGGLLHARVLRGTRVQVADGGGARVEAYQAATRAEGQRRHRGREPLGTRLLGMLRSEEGVSVKAKAAACVEADWEQVLQDVESTGAGVVANL